MSAETSDTFAVSGLARKRAEIAGQVADLESRLAQARADIGHLDGAIRLLDPTYRPETVRPKRQPTQHEAWFGPGELGRLALDVLRRSPERLTVATIAREIMQRRGMDSGDEETVRRLGNMLQGVLRRRPAIVERVELGQRMVGWRIRA